MSDIIPEESEEFFSGNEWAFVPGCPIKQDILAKQVEEFLAGGGKIETIEVVTRNGPATFNNRLVSFDYDKNSIFSRSEHDEHYRTRVYGSDTIIVDKIKDLASTKMTAEEIMTEVSEVGQKISPSRFKRLVMNYLGDYRPAYRFLASYNDLAPTKNREIERIALDALFKAYAAGKKKRAAWDFAAEETGFTVRAIISIAHRRGAEALWKKKIHK